MDEDGEGEEGEEEEEGVEDDEELEDEDMSEHFESEHEDTADEEDEEEWHGIGTESESEEVPSLIQANRTEATNEPVATPQASTSGMQYGFFSPTNDAHPMISIEVCSSAPSETRRGRERRTVGITAKAHAAIERSSQPVRPNMESPPAQSLTGITV